MALILKFFKSFVSKLSEALSARFNWHWLLLPFLLVFSEVGALVAEVRLPASEYFFNTFHNSKPAVVVDRSRWKLLNEREGLYPTAPLKALAPPLTLWSSSKKLSDNDLLAFFDKAKFKKFWAGVKIESEELRLVEKLNSSVFVVGHINAAYRIFVNGRFRAAGNGKDFLPAMISVVPEELAGKDLKIAVELNHNLGSARPIAASAPYPTGFFSPEGAMGLRNFWIFISIVTPVVLGLLAFLFSMFFFFLWSQISGRAEYIFFSSYMFCLSTMEVLRWGDIKFGMERMAIYKLGLFLDILQGVSVALVGFSYARLRPFFHTSVVLAGALVIIVLFHLGETGQDYLLFNEYVSRTFIPICFAFGAGSCLIKGCLLVPSIVGDTSKGQTKRLFYFSSVLFLAGATYFVESFKIISLDASAFWHRPVQFLVIFIEGTFLFYDYRQTKAAYYKTHFFGEAATQLAHDIRGPLEALESVVSGMQTLRSDERILVENVSRRIRGIANDLLGQSNEIHDGTPAQAQLLYSVHVDAVAKEKRDGRVGRTKVEIEFFVADDARAVFIGASAAKLERAVSNFLDNAIEAASENSGQVFISVLRDSDRVIAEIRDNGAGISADVSKVLGLERVSSKKANFMGGAGIGFLNSKKSIEESGGSVKVASAAGLGTSIKIEFPIVAAPDWFVSEIVLSKDAAIAFVGGSLYGQMEPRLKEYGTWNMNLLSAASLGSWATARGNKSSDLFLFDYEEVEVRENCLGLITKLKIAAQSILVTDRFQSDQLQTQCAKLGIKILPRALLIFTPLILQKENRRLLVDAILVEDDDSTRLAWQLSAKRAGKDLHVFSTIETFMSSIGSYDRRAIIYLDSNFNGPRRGEDIAETLGNMGFSKIFLATGYRPSAFKKCEWIKGIVGKVPPWSA